MGYSLLRLLAQGTRSLAHPVLSDCLRLLRTCAGRAQVYSVSTKRRRVSTKMERVGHQRT